MKVLIALNENKNLDSKLSEHFGHCPYFAIFDTDTKNIEYIDNIIDHSNVSLTPVDQIMKFNPDIVVTKGIGQRAVRLFQEKKIEVKYSEYDTLKEVINNLDNLKNIDLKDACNH